MSKLFQLNFAEIGKAVLMAFISAFVLGIFQAVKAGGMPSTTQLIAALCMGIAAILGYLVTKVLTDGNGKILGMVPISLSTIGSVNLIDLIRGFVYAFFTTLFMAIIPVLQSGSFPAPSELGKIFTSAFVLTISYLAKNMVTNSKNELGKPEPLPALKL